MSKLFKLAIEGINEEGLGGTCLSMEELIENEVSIMEDIRDGNQELAEVSRTIDTADNLSDLSQIIGKIKEPAATDIALVHTAANMAVAGTTADATTLVPGTEGFRDMKYAAESIMEKVKALYSLITGFFSKIIDKAIGIFKKIKDSLTTYAYNYTSIIKQAQEVPDDVEPSPSFTIRKPGSDIYLNGKIPASFEDYANAFDQWKKEMDVLNKGANLITDTGATIISEFVKVKPETMDKFVTSSYNAMHKALITFAKSLPNKEVVPDSGSDGNIYKFKTVYGSNGFSVQVPNSPIQNPDAYDILRTPYHPTNGKIGVRGVTISTAGGKEALIKFATKAREYINISIRTVIELEKKYQKMDYLLKGIRNYTVTEEGEETYYDEDGNSTTHFYEVINESTKVMNRIIDINWKLSFPALVFHTKVNNTIKNLCNYQLKALHGRT